MSFKSLALALSDALIEDLRSFEAFAMASIQEYGKVGGYAAPLAKSYSGDFARFAPRKS